MTEEEFRQAIRDAMDESIERDLAAYKEKYGDEPHVFSAEHEAKMRAIFDSFEKKQRRRTRRALVAAACIVFIFGLTACTTPLIQQSIAGFCVQAFGDHTEYTDPAVTKECIEEEYGLAPVPYGFEITDIIKTDTLRFTTYTDDDNNTISLHQVADKSFAAVIDNEHGTLIETDLGDRTVMLFMGESSAQASWVEDGYYFSLSYSSPIDQEQFEEWIAAVTKL